MKYRLNVLGMLCLFFVFSCTNSVERRESVHSFPGKRINPFRLRFGGDVILAVSIDKYVKKHGVDYPLARLGNWLQSSDHTVVNLESCFTTNGRAYRFKKYTFRAKPEMLSMLKSNGVDSVTLANNHLLDFGTKGMEDTFAVLNRFGISGFGAGKNLAMALAPYRTIVNGTEVVLFSVCDITPRAFYATSNRPGTAPLLLSRLVPLIRKYKRSDNLVIVLPHWGYETYPYPLARHVRAAHRMIDAGCDAVIGHHPHVPQSIEVYKNRPVVYSLGNLLVGYWNRRYRNNIGVTLNCLGGRIVALDIHSIAGRNHLIGFQPFVVTGETGKRDMRYLNWISRRFGTRIQVLEDGSGRIEFPLHN